MGWRKGEQLCVWSCGGSSGGHHMHTREALGSFFIFGGELLMVFEHAEHFGGILEVNRLW